MKMMQRVSSHFAESHLPKFPSHQISNFYPLNCLARWICLAKERNLYGVTAKRSPTMNK